MKCHLTELDQLLGGIALLGASCVVLAVVALAIILALRVSSR